MRSVWLPFDSNHTFIRLCILLLPIHFIHPSIWATPPILLQLPFLITPPGGDAYSPLKPVQQVPPFFASSNSHLRLKRYVALKKMALLVKIPPFVASNDETTPARTG